MWECFCEVGGWRKKSWFERKCGPLVERVSWCNDPRRVLGWTLLNQAVLYCGLHLKKRGVIYYVKGTQE